MSIQQAAELYAEKEKDLYIQTYKGGRFYLSHPEFDIEEIAHATSLQCRFTGHIDHFYSVAEHGVLVSKLMELVPECRELGGTPYEGLMHDAHEGYISDIASPWKVAIGGGYKAVESKVERAMRDWAGLPAVISEGVKRADWLALFIEAQLMLKPGVSDDWLTPDDIVRPLSKRLVASGWDVRGWTPREAKSIFLTRYNQLRLYAAWDAANAYQLG